MKTIKNAFSFEDNNYSYPGDEIRNGLDKENILCPIDKFDEELDKKIRPYFLYRAQLVHIGEENKKCVAIYDDIDTLDFNRVLYIFDNDSEIDRFVESLKEAKEHKKKIWEQIREDDRKFKDNIAECIRLKGGNHKIIPYCTKKEKIRLARLSRIYMGEIPMEIHHMLEERYGIGRNLIEVDYQTSLILQKQYSVFDVIKTAFN